MTEEDRLIQHVGKEDPFPAPEGYFDTFETRLMKRLEEEQAVKPSKASVFRLSPKIWRYAAAVAAVAAVVCVGVFMPSWRNNGQDLASNEQETEVFYDENYMNEELDYAMVDNHEIASYLTENQY